MKCPVCGHPDSRVAWLRERDGRDVRARDCTNCGKRFQTAEAPIEHYERAARARTALLEAMRSMGYDSVLDLEAALSELPQKEREK